MHQSGLARGRQRDAASVPAHRRALAADPPAAAADPWVDPSRGVTITTPFVTLPDFVEAECAEHNGFSYLAITVQGEPADPRIDDIGGDLTPEWGLHLVDANVAMGDLVALARSQAHAYRARHR